MGPIAATRFSLSRPLSPKLHTAARSAFCDKASNPFNPVFDLTEQASDWTSCIIFLSTLQKLFCARSRDKVLEQKEKVLLFSLGLQC